MTLHQKQSRLSIPGLEAMDPDSLFLNHVRLKTRNPEHAKASVEQVFFRHSLRTSSRGLVNFTHRSASLSSLSFNLIRYGADVEVTTDDVNRSHYVMVVPLSGKAEVKNHDQMSALSCGHFVMLDPMTSFRFDMLADHSHLAIGIPKDRLSAQMGRLVPRLAANRMELSRSPYAVNEDGRSLFDFLAYICNELDSPRTLTCQNWVSGAMEESFLTLLVSSLFGGKDLQDARIGEAIAPFYIRKAENFIAANLTEEITIDDILHVAGVPERTLYHSFRKYRGVSPAIWLKCQRLRQARLDLLRGVELGLTVTEVAHRYQMPHVGRFARAYFQEFGEFPSDTLKKQTCS